jgi:hypothetical protein
MLTVCSPPRRAFTTKSSSYSPPTVLQEKVDAILSVRAAA